MDEYNAFKNWKTQCYNTQISPQINESMHSK